MRVLRSRGRGLRADVPLAPELGEKLCGACCWVTVSIAYKSMSTPTIRGQGPTTVCALAPFPWRQRSGSIVKGNSRSDRSSFMRKTRRRLVTMAGVVVIVGSGLGMASKAAAEARMRAPSGTSTIGGTSASATDGLSTGQDAGVKTPGSDLARESATARNSTVQSPRARRARDLDDGTDAFKNSDEDRNNRLSEEEFENFNRRNGKPPADDNQEGAVVRDFSKRDQNRDGRLTTDEAIVVPER